MKLLVVSMFILFFTSCSTSKMLSDSEIKNISFGSGGGFSGNINKYDLNNKGHLINSESSILKVNKDKLNSLYTQAENLLNYDYRTPRNIYNFITISTNSDTNHIVWGHEDLDVSIKVKQLYEDLQQLIKVN